MKRIMLVEDEEFILQGIRCIVDWDAMDMEVVYMAHNGQEALEYYKKDPVDIVLTDVEMPLLDGLGLIGEIRKINQRTRCLILSGYDEFEYARTAVKLDVEDYVLKPVNEEKLEQALRQAGKRLEEMDRKYAANMEDKVIWLQFLRGKLDDEEAEKFCRMLPAIGAGQQIFPAVMKVDLETLEETEGISRILVELQETGRRIKPVYLGADVLLLLLYCGIEEDEYSAEQFYSEFQNDLESTYGIMSFLTVGPSAGIYEELPRCYQKASGLQRYRILSGYGSCISERQIQNRGNTEVAIDEALLRKIILKKDQEGALKYLEELFLNSMQAGTVSVDVPYQIALKVAMLLEDIKSEYKMGGSKDFQGVSGMLEKIYKAEDLFGLRTVLMLEITAVITQLHTENSQYTPVVRQIMKTIDENYKEDMNLKTLSYKYNMNTSYLGQIFQKEVGCSFNQYLNNIKNEKARHLILHTNMKINDIAREVGYPDTSYFYRKFKQCYGVSPASLRNMKKY